MPVTQNPGGFKMLDRVIACDDSYRVSLVFALTTPLSVLSHLYFPLTLLSTLPHLNLLYFSLARPLSHPTADGVCARQGCSHAGSSHLTTLTCLVPPPFNNHSSWGCSKWCCSIVLCFPQYMLLELCLPFSLIHKFPITIYFFPFFVAI